VREKKSESELKVIVMAEIRKHPEWTDVVHVAITRPIRASSM
jgi:hypothetical protein